MTYQRITFIEKPQHSPRTIILRITKETDKFLFGIEVDNTGDAVVRKNVDETQHIISKDMLSKRVDLVMKQHLRHTGAKTMSKEQSVTYNTSTFGVPWLLIFLVIKLGGTSLAAWSWWWIFLPIVPVLVLFLKWMGLL